MEPPDLDDVDRGILHMLQLDARNNSASVIADEVGVAPNTVRNRIDRLEAAGVIRGYHPHIDYERAGFQLRVVFVCTARVAERGDLADRVLDVEGVVGVTEILSGTENILVEAVSDTTDDLTRIAAGLEDLGLEIRDERFVKNARVQPFDNFGVDEARE
ncbi:Lrp/AsnC family transcriptional regulator [Halostella sp. JP-L12]|uniref:Lrp/AsnC family transcriptional regulator n=1 Tax=Halostella TaxID=1843185 RepID=UPI000EF79AF1|nr:MULTISPECIES: Lrp/AsnC family transcriptional regulator [Halostella]NHN48943.1 Lrp/AsnC family transcriptional regulator [Halostella sp. JP-L12]